MESPISAKLDVKVGETTTDAIVKAAIDSPAGAALGFLTDLINGWRDQNAVRVFKKIKEAAEKEGLAVEPPSGKFVAAFLSAVGGEDDHSLDDLWAQLFLNTTTDNSGIGVHFIETMRRVSKREAATLRGLATKLKTNPDSVAFHSQAVFHDICEYNHFIGMTDLERSFLADDKPVTPEAAISKFGALADRLPVIVASFRHTKDGVAEGFLNVAVTKLYSDNAGEINLLTELGLLRRDEFATKLLTHPIREVSVYELTPTGVSFLRIVGELPSA